METVKKSDKMKKDDTNSVVEVVRRMQTEYAQTGLYNSTDLQRVLGNPKDSVGFTSPSYTSPGNHKKKAYA